MWGISINNYNEITYVIYFENYILRKEPGTKKWLKKYNLSLLGLLALLLP